MAVATVAFCTHNRASLLPILIGELRAQYSPAMFEILAVNNNSSDMTIPVLEELRKEPGAPLRVVTEIESGIVPARNRAVEESLKSDFLIFLDDDELPEPGFMAAAIDALQREGAECVGGKICVRFVPAQRPAWLNDPLLRYLGELDNGGEPFWITEKSTPVWCGNAGFSTDVFRCGLRFDDRHNRVGKKAGGGEDVVLFETLLEQGARIRYRPDMIIHHLVEDWRLRRQYFLHVAYLHGLKQGLMVSNSFEREVYGLPLFMFRQVLSRTFCSLFFVLCGKHGALREAMKAAYTAGSLFGRFKRHWMGHQNKLADSR